MFRSEVVNPWFGFSVMLKHHEMGYVEMQFEGLFHGHRFCHGLPQQRCRESGEEVESYLGWELEEEGGKGSWETFSGIEL